MPENVAAMASPYTYVPDLSGQEIPADGILSRTLYEDAQAKVVLFAFSAGQELSEHTSSKAAIIHVLRGEARLVLGEDAIDAGPGAWVYMPPQLRHAVRAKTPMVMLLTLLKSA